MAAGYLLAGDALQHAMTTGCCNGVRTNNVLVGGASGRGGKDGVNDVVIGTARLRYSF
jgi:hypothetical protein